jgi:hypothetical protein
MKSLKISLNTQSIDQAKQSLANIKQILVDQVTPVYLERAAQWIKNRANEILAKSDIGKDVIRWISNSWHINVASKSRVILSNTSWKAVWVEFGVGIVGQSNKHPNADKEGYEYNVDSGKKFGQGYWTFSIKDESKLDIPQEAIVDEDYTDDGLSITTQGTKGVWYLYNAVQDFKMNEQRRLWNEVLGEFIK